MRRESTWDGPVCLWREFSSVPVGRTQCMSAGGASRLCKEAYSYLGPPERSALTGLHEGQQVVVNVVACRQGTGSREGALGLNALRPPRPGFSRGFETRSRRSRPRRLRRSRVVALGHHINVTGKRTISRSTPKHIADHDLGSCFTAFQKPNR